MNSRPSQKFPGSPNLIPCDHEWGSVVKNPPANAGDAGSIPGSGGSPGERKGYPLQCSGPENSMDCIVHRVAKSQTRLSDFHLLFHKQSLQCGCTDKFRGSG